MGLENCQIRFNNTESIFFPGQTISGQVEFNFNSLKKVRGISISFKGEANTHWTETESRKDMNGKSRTEYVHFKGHEEYFSVKYYVVGGPNSPTTELSAGQHIFPFSTSLPQFLPSSFEGEHGHVRYTVKATLDRPWKFDQTIKAAFTVVSHLDCNSNLKAREPATLTMEKHLCCLCCREGPITGVLKLPCTGYVAGQIIPYTLEIDNASKTRVDHIKMKLKKTVTYRATSPRSKTKSQEVTVLEFKVGENVDQLDNKVFRNNFKLSSLPPSNLEHCHIIDIAYELKISVEIDGFHKNMIGNIPVTIGTIPLVNMIPLTSEITSTHVKSNSSRQPLLGWIPAPAAPSAPVDPYSIPPPTYEESQFGTKSILDSSDSEHTRFNKDKCYAPCYPVYNFNMPGQGPSMVPLPSADPSAPPPLKA